MRVPAPCCARLARKAVSDARGVGADDDERTNLAAAARDLRAELVDKLTDSLLAHSDSARGLYPTPG